jgi:hypothetical protein
MTKAHIGDVASLDIQFILDIHSTHGIQDTRLSRFILFILFIRHTVIQYIGTRGTDFKNI